MPKMYINGYAWGSGGQTYAWYIDGLVDGDVQGAVTDPEYWFGRLVKDNAEEFTELINDWVKSKLDTTGAYPDPAAATNFSASFQDTHLIFQNITP